MEPGVQRLSRPFHNLAIHGNGCKSKALGDLCGQLSHSLIRANAHTILTHSYHPHSLMP